MGGSQFSSPCPGVEEDCQQWDDPKGVTYEWEEYIKNRTGFLGQLWVCSAAKTQYHRLRVWATGPCFLSYGSLEIQGQSWNRFDLEGSCSLTIRWPSLCVLHVGTHPWCLSKCSYFLSVWRHSQRRPLNKLVWIHLTLQRLHPKVSCVWSRKPSTLGFHGSSQANVNQK